MTDLARQLQRIQIRQLPKNLQASLLFSPKDAKKIDSEIIFSIGINGLEEIKRHSTQFLVYFSDLFNERFAQENCFRDGLMKEQLLILDQEIRAVLDMLSPYFLLQCTHKILEMLIRYYQVNVYYVDEIIRAFLPFHDTKVFARLLQILMIRDTYWDFLHQNQKDGYLIKRRQIIKRAAKDLKLFTIILEDAMKSLFHLRFAGVVIIEVIALVVQLKENQLIEVFQFVNKCFTSNDTEAIQLGYMIVVKISQKSPLSADYLQALIYDILRVKEDENIGQMATANVLIQQHQINKLPGYITDLTVKESNLSQLLCIKKDASNLCCIVFRKLIGKIQENSLKLVQLINAVRFTKDTLMQLLFIVFKQYVILTPKKLQYLNQSYVQVLDAFGQIYIDQVAELIPEIIREIQLSHKDCRQKLYKLISVAFSGIPFDESNDLPLVISLSSNQESIRFAAVNQLGENITNLHRSVIQLIKNEQNLDILQQLLDNPSLGQIDQDYLYSTLFQRFKEFYTWQNPPVITLRSIFEWLTFKIQHPENINHIELIFLAYDSQDLRDLCPQAIGNAKHFLIFANFDGREITRYLIEEFTKSWVDQYTTLKSLIRLPLSRRILIAVLENLKKNMQFILKEFVLSCHDLVQEIIQESDEFGEILMSIVDNMPKLSNIKKQDVYQVAYQCCIDMLQYSLKSDMELASAIIHKHFSSNAIQSLLKVSENSPEALAMSLALCKDNPECLIEVVGYLLVNINREDSFKNVSLFSMQEFCEDQLETIEINAKLAPSSEFARLAPLKSDLEQLLYSIINYTQGLANDSLYMQYFMQQNYKSNLIPFVQIFLQCSFYGRNILLKQLELVKDQSLIEAIIDFDYSLDERVSIVKMLKGLDWVSPKISEVILDWLEEQSILEIILSYLVQRDFDRLKKEQQYNIMKQLNQHLLNGSIELIEQIKGVISDIKIDWVIFDKLLGDYSIEHSFSVIELMQQQIKFVSNDLINLHLKYYSSLIEVKSEKSQYTKQLLLINLRIFNYPLNQTQLQTISKELQNTNTQTKHQILQTLTIYAQNHPQFVFEQFYNNFNVTNEDFAYGEIFIYKQALENSAKQFQDQCFDISPLILKIIDCIISSKASDKGQSIGDLITKLGTGYAYKAIIALLDRNHQLVFDFLMRFKYNDQIIILNDILQAILFDIISQKQADIAQLSKVFQVLQEYFERPDGYRTIERAMQMGSVNLNLILRYSLSIKREVEKLINAVMFRKQIDHFVSILNNIFDDQALVTSVIDILSDSESVRSRRIKKDCLELLIVRNTFNKQHQQLIPYLMRNLFEYRKKLQSIQRKQKQSKINYLYITLKVLSLVMNKSTAVIKMLDQAKILLRYCNCPIQQLKEIALECFTVFFKTQNSDSLPYIESYLKSLLETLQKSQDTEQLLKCLKRVVVVQKEFIAPYVFDIFKVLIQINEDTFKLIKAICNNVPSYIVLEQLPELIDQTKYEKQFKRLVFAGIQVASLLRSKDSTVYQTKINSLIIKLCSWISFNPSEEVQNLMIILNDIGNVFVKFAVNFSNKQLKEVFSDIIQWATDGKDGIDNLKMLNLMVIVKKLSAKLKSHFSIYCNYIWDQLTDILSNFAQKYSQKHQKRQRDDYYDIPIAQNSLKILQNISQYDQKQFLNFDKYDKLATLIANLYSTHNLGSDYTNFVESHVTQTYIKLLASTQDQTIWQSFNFRMISNSRHPQTLVKVQSFKALNKSIDKLGSDISGLLPDIVPFIGEGLEDDNEMVNNESKAAMRKLEVVCKTDLKEYFTQQTKYEYL